MGGGLRWASPRRASLTFAHGRFRDAAGSGSSRVVLRRFAPCGLLASIPDAKNTDTMGHGPLPSPQPGDRLWTEKTNGSIVLEMGFCLDHI